MKLIYLLSTILVIIGAVKWGLGGLMNMDLVAIEFGSMTTVARAVYIIIGVAGLVKLLGLLKCKKSQE